MIGRETLAVKNVVQSTITLVIHDVKTMDKPGSDS